jgi:hypothetical protein
MGIAARGDSRVKQTWATVALVSVLVTASGCRYKRAGVMQYMDTAPSTRAAFEVAAGQRYLAVRHKLQIIAPESELVKRWESVIQFCGSIRCEVISSSIAAGTHDSPPAGEISLRVAPEDLQKLLAELEKNGQIAQHTTETEDKTIVVVDTDARIKNLTGLRDTLRAMQGKASLSVRDLAEIQAKLADVQSQLDSQTTQRKILANETEKIAVEVVFRVERTISSAGTFTPIGDALRESASVLAESLAALITVIVAAVPWLILVAPISWLIARVWRRRRRRVGFAPSPPPEV